MTVVSDANISKVVLAVDPLLQFEIEQFLYLEAELLDERKWSQWYDLMASDVTYFMPTRSNRTSREIHLENSVDGQVANFDDDKRTLGWRVRQLESGMHWAEDPPSRTRHVVSNVRIRPADNSEEFHVRSNFICYRNRAEDEVDIWAGERQDVVRRVSEQTWQVAKRYILLDQNVVLSKNLSIFF